MITKRRRHGHEVQPLNGKLAWFPMANKVIEIIAVHGNIVMFIMMTDEGPRINRTYMYCIELME